MNTETNHAARWLLALCFSALSLTGWADGRLTQRLRGQVVDRDTQTPLPGAVVRLSSADSLYAVTDADGYFVLPEVPVGRHTLQVSMITYAPSLLPELLVGSSKECVVRVEMHPQTATLSEVLITPKVNKQEPLNSMALTGGRMFSVEESSRYAGGVNDPSRLVASFAGVVSESTSTGISIHGNAPGTMLWRLEGINIPAPTHYTDMSLMGGGTFTSLSNNVLDNSDFFTGGMPAEYINTGSGVFDMKMRTGNNEHHEQTFQAGVLGIDFAAEGPLSGAHRASYLVNYRYSFTGLLDKIGMMPVDATMDYQDLNFKLNFPTRHCGTFSWWATALYDKYVDGDIDHKKHPSEVALLEDTGIYTERQRMVATGVNHRLQLGGKSVLTSSLATVYNQPHRYYYAYEWDEATGLYTDSRPPYQDFKMRETHIIAAASISTRLGSRWMSKNGVSFDQMYYKADMWMAPAYYQPMRQITQGSDNAQLIHAYTSNSWKVSDAWTLNLGLATQHFSLSDNWTLEPRLAARWQLSPKVSLAAAYTITSNTDRLDAYLYKDNDGNYANKHLDMRRNQHLTVGLKWQLAPDMLLSIDPFVQRATHVPVSADPADQQGSWNIINWTDYYIDRALVSKGKFRSYGIDLTLEKYLTQGYYWMLTGTLFDAKCTGIDGKWHNTVYNSRYVANVLGGKEWTLGKQQNNLLGVNLEASVVGGFWHSPFDYDLTVAQQNTHPKAEFDYSHPMSVQGKTRLLVSLGISYKINHRKTAHEFMVQLTNLTQEEDQLYYAYDRVKKEIRGNDVVTSLPNIYYRINF